MSAVVILAVTAGDALITYGPLGIGVLALGVFAARQFDWQVKRGDKAEARSETMVDEVFTKVLPALARNTEVLAKRTDLDREIVETLKDTNDVLRDISQGREPPRAGRGR